MVDVEESVVLGRRPPVPNHLPEFAEMIENCWVRLFFIFSAFRFFDTLGK